MTDPQLPPVGLLDRIERDHDTAVAALADLTQQVARLRALLVAAPHPVPAGVAAPELAYPPPPPGSRPLVGPRSLVDAARVRSHAAPPASIPVAASARVAAAVPAVPAEPNVPWYQREGMVSRVMAFVGAGVLLVGVALLLVLAAQQGLFGPVARTVAGGALAVGLVAGAFALRRRLPGNVGAIAMAASGVAAAYLDVVAISAIYGWLDRAPALGLALALALGGLALARGWCSEALAVLTVGGAMLLVPFVSPSLTLGLGFLAVLTVSALVVQGGTPWPVLLVVRSVPTAAVAFFVAFAINPHHPDVPWLVAVVIVLGLVALATCWLAETGVLPAPAAALTLSAATTTPTPDAPAHDRHRARTARPREPRVAAALLPLLAAPWLAAGAALERTTGLVLLALAAALFLAVAWWRSLGAAARGGAGVVGTVAALLVLLRLTDGEYAGTILLGIALATLVVAVLTGDRLSLVRGLVAAAAGVVVWAPPAVLLVTGGSTSRAGELLLMSLLVAACAVAAGFESLRAASPTWRSARYWPFALLIAASTAAIVAVGVLGGGALQAETDGFRAAHAVVTVAWMVAAGWLLLSGLHSAERPLRRRVGVALAALAVAKLFLFDLAALPGLARIFAFIVGGLVLIGLGVLYSRASDRAHG